MLETVHGKQTTIMLTLATTPHNITIIEAGLDLLA